MRLNKGDIASSPTDLDGDGEQDLYLDASKRNIETVLSNLQNKLEEDDHLFIFVIDHGGLYQVTENIFEHNQGDAYILLWNYERLYCDEFVEMVKPFSDKYVNLNIIMGQCYSGAFAKALKGLNCVIATACGGDESSNPSDNFIYDEYVFHWTCAINSYNPLTEKTVNADFNNDGFVSMFEAAKYATESEIYSNFVEHPQYYSNPRSIGEDLAFNRIAPAVDLYIKDTETDSGMNVEPITSPHDSWNSPSIWVKNQGDLFYTPEIPKEDTSNINVIVHNRGKKSYNKTDQPEYLNVYASNASTIANYGVWTGNELHNGSQTGGLVASKLINPVIPAGDSLKIVIPCNFKTANVGDITKPFDILAVIEDKSNTSNNYRPLDIALNKRFAQKSLIPVNSSCSGKAQKLFMRNITSQKENYSLEIKPKTSFDERIFDFLTIQLIMSDEIFRYWRNGGSQVFNMRPTSATSKIFTFIDKTSKIKKIQIPAFSKGELSLNLTFKRYANTQTPLVFDLIQRDENGNIVGGETFSVEIPPASQSQNLVAQNIADDGSVELSYPDDDVLVCNWLDYNGVPFSEEKTITFKPSNQQNEISISTVNTDGELYLEKLKFESAYAIEAIKQTPNNTLSVELKNAVDSERSQLLITEINTSTAKTVILNKSEKTVNVDLNNSPKGIYSVTYIVNGELQDSKNITIK
ncbi:MAG: C13 family peptidase [Prevotella sp.]|nr:C13 family peptidase [Prevotella sp.]MCM1074256.1 C13 family peptidase [Ruminococcus sp.]